MTTIDEYVVKCPVRGTQWTQSLVYTQVCAFHATLVAMTETLPEAHPLSWLVHRPISTLPLQDVLTSEATATKLRRRQRCTAANELIDTVMHARVMVDGYCRLKESARATPSPMLAHDLAPFVQAQRAIDAFLPLSAELPQSCQTHTTAFNLEVPARGTLSLRALFEQFTEQCAADSRLRYLAWLLRQVAPPSTDCIVADAPLHSAEWERRLQWLVAVSQQSVAISSSNDALSRAMERVARAFADEDDDPCVICWEPMDDASAVDTLDCLHRFHTTCMAEWIQQRKVCPTCCRVVNRAGPPGAWDHHPPQQRFPLAHPHDRRRRWRFWEACAMICLATVVSFATSFYYSSVLLEVASPIFP